MMTGLPWVKIWVEMLDDVKISRLTEAQRWRFIELILLAAECDADGALVTGDSPMTHRDVSWRLRCDEKRLSQDVTDIASAGLIHDDNGVIVVSKFSERQGPTQAEKRKVWRERQKTHRERVNIANVTHDSRMTHANVTGVEREEEKEEEEEKKRVTPAPAALLITDRDAESLFCRITNFVSIPPGEIRRLDQIIGFIQTYGLASTEQAMTSAFGTWIKTQRKDGSGTYRATNCAWVDRAQEQLAGNGTVTKDPMQMTHAEFQAYYAAKAKEQP